MKKLKKTSVVLREIQDKDGKRRLSAGLEGDGVVIRGWDYGDGVECFFGYREYEWVWTVRAQHVSALLSALGAEGDVISALERRFSGDRSGEIGPFLEEHAIPYESWSRVGD